MAGYAAEIDRIKKTLKANPRGMTILSLSKELNISRNSAAKYLDILLVSGQVEMESVGPAKIYFLSHRIPSSTLMNYSSDHVLVLNSEFKVTQINNGFLDLIGVKREEAIGKNVEDPLFPFSTNLEILSKIDEAMQGNGYSGNIDLSTAEKVSHFEIKLIPSVLDSGSPGVSIVMNDVTEEKEMKQRLDKYHRLLKELTKEHTMNSELVSEEHRDGIVDLKENDVSHRRDVKNQAILDAMPDLIFLIRRDGTFLDYIAPSDKHLFAPPSEFLGKKVNEIMPETLSEQIMLCIEQALQTSEMQTIQYQLPINDNILDYEARIVASTADEVMVIATDITERKKAEKKLKRLNEKLKRKLEIEHTLSNITYMFITSTDIDTTIMNALRKSGELCGASRAYIFLFRENGTVMDNTYEWCSEGVEPQKENLQNLPVNMFPWWMDKLHNHESIHIKDVSALPKEASTEKEILEMQGIRSLIVFPLYANNELIGFIGMDNVLNAGDWEEEDIAVLRMMSYTIGTGIEREQMETSLRENEKRLADAQHVAHIGNWDWDIINNELYWSDEIYHIFGHSPQEFEGTYEAFLSFVHPDDRDFVQDSVNKALYENKPYSIDHRITLSDGSERVVHERAEVTFNEDGQAIRMIGTVQDITKRKQAEEALRESEVRVKRKLNAILDQDGDIGELELVDIIDSETLQSLIDDFYRLTHIAAGIVDLHGNLLVSSEWQDICTKFHRANPQTCAYCIESNVQLSSGVAPGDFKLYKCKNNMWEMVTPLMVGGLHIGNLFLGQFFFEDEEIDYATFRLQAEQYGFDEKEYLEALDRVPRLSRETVNATMEFYTRLTDVISSLSYSNIKLARALNERDNLLTSLHESESRFRSYVEQAPDGVFIADEKGNYIDVNEAASRITGYSREELLRMNLIELISPDDKESALLHFQTVVKTGTSVGDLHFLTRGGKRIICTVKAVKLSKTRFLGFVHDITERKHAEKKPGT